MATCPYCHSEIDRLDSERLGLDGGDNGALVTTCPECAAVLGV